MNRLSALVSGLVLVALPPATVLADTVYTYTGNPYTATGGPFAPGEFLSGSFTLSSPLAANLPLTSIDPSEFSLSNGPTMFTGATTFISFFEVSTDSAGGIESWNINLEGDVFTDRLFTSSNGAQGLGEDLGQTFSSPATYSGTIVDDPGRWTVSTADPAVPEPASLLLLGTGIIGGLGAFRRRLTLS